MAQETFRPVDDLTADRVKNYNNRFISDRLYFAKRHRIVEVDIESLRQSERSTITLFEGGNQYEIQRRQLAKSQIYGASRWVGNVVLPDSSLSEDNLSADELEDISKSGMTLDQINSQIGRVELFMLEWDVNVQTGEAIPSAERRSKALSPTQTQDSENGTYIEGAFSSLSGDIDLSAEGGGLYRIEALENSPRYHLLYEVDNSKTFGAIETGVEADGDVSEAQRKKRAYDNFVNSLPTEPKRKTVGGRL